ncbi:hypothetical protein OAK97_00850, partial [bacterium]|nr:hypothetical protein [bacterium]
QIKAYTDEICDSWSFYCHQLNLSLFLRVKQAVELFNPLLEYGITKETWAIDDDDRLIPLRKSLKHMALVCLRQMNKGKDGISAEEWLTCLCGSPVFGGMELSRLKHLYSNWKNDEAFAIFDIFFPRQSIRRTATSREGKNDTARISTVKVAGRRTERSAEALPQALQALEQLSQQVLGVVDDQIEPSILGLLPLEEEAQMKIRDQVRKACNGRPRKLLSLLEDYPAVAAYAVSYAVAHGMKTGRQGQYETLKEGGGFYNAIKKELDLEVGGVFAAEFAYSFQQAIHQLGIVVGVLPEDHTSNVHTYPAVFQAGVLGYWPEHLAKAIKSYLKKNPPPDLEDELRILKFTEYLANHVPHGQVRLSTMLNTEVGPLVSKAVMRAVVKEDFSLLPPHLRKPMASAFEHAGADYLRSPYLSYQTDGREIELVLPRQGSHLVNRNVTYWEAGKDTRINPLRRRTVPIQDLEGETVIVRLCNLANNFEDQEYEVSLHPTPEEPVFIFRETDGRKLQLSQIRSDLDVEVEINPGDYTLVLMADCTTDDEELFQLSGEGFRTGQLPLAAGDDPLSVYTGERTISIRPRLISGIRVGGAGSKVLTDINGQRIYFSESLEVVAHIPTTVLNDDEEVVMSVSTPATSEVVPMEIAFLSPNTEGAFSFFDLWDCLIKPFIDTLGPGIHQLEICGLVKSRKFTTKLHYWKGLESVDQAEDFRCSEMPRNIDWNNSAGLSKKNRGLLINPRHPGPIASLAINRPDRVFYLNKPGLWVSVHSTENLAEDHLRLGESFEINTAFQQELRIVSGDQCDWKLFCGESQLGHLTRYRPTHRLYCAALLGEFGDTGRVVARDDFGKEVHLFSFARASVARELTYESGTETGHTKASFRLGRDTINGLRLSIRNFASEIDDVWEREWPFEPGQHECIVPGLPEPIQLGMESTDNDIVVSVNSEHLNSGDGIYFLDFAIRKAAAEAWFPLKVAETHNLSEVRFAIFARPVTKSGESYWGGVLNAAFSRAWGSPDSDSEPLPESTEDVAMAIEKFQSALLFKYPSQVWPHVAWIKSAYHRFCQLAFSPTNGDCCRIFAERAIHGLARKELETFSILSALLMAQQDHLLALPGQLYPESPSNSMTEQCFEQLRAMAGYESLAGYLKEHMTVVDLELFTCFANFNSVASSKASEFTSFDHHVLSERFRSTFDRYQRTREREQSYSLLSPWHLLKALRPLNRRLRPFEEVRNNDSLFGQLATFSGWIHQAANQAFRIWPALHQHAGIPMHQDDEIFHFDQVVEMDLAKEVALVLCAVAGLGRLAAGGFLSYEQYQQQLLTIFKTHDDRGELSCDRLSLVLGLGPEVFAFYMFFWELLLKTKKQK